MAVGLQVSMILIIFQPHRADSVIGERQDNDMYQVSCTLSEAWIQIFNRLR